MKVVTPAIELPEQMRARLDERIFNSAEELNEVCRIGLPADRQKYEEATLDFGLCAMAEFAVRDSGIVVVPLEFPKWIRVAHEILNRYSKDDKSQEYVLVSQFFATQKNQRARKDQYMLIHRLVNARLSTQADGIEFVELVANGLKLDRAVTRKDRSNS